MKTELIFLSEVVELLRPHGDARLEYITAELQPFSNQFKPDIVFIPRSGKNQYKIFVIEYKMFSKKTTILRSSDIVEHREFASNVLETDYISYLFLTNVELSNDYLDDLKNNKIVGFKNIESASTIYSTVYRFAKLRPVLVDT